MEPSRFKKEGLDVLQFIIDYHKNVSSQTVKPMSESGEKIEPGFLIERLPKDVPNQPEEWSEIIKELDSKILTGFSHWQHPRFFAYYPASSSYPSILADLLISGLGNLPLSWASSPAGTELELVMLDWAAQLFGLPEQFLSENHNQPGGGVIHNGASECVMAALVAAREAKMRALKDERSAGFNYSDVCGEKLVAYCSDQAHDCAEKGAKIAMVKIRVLKSLPDGTLSPESLQHAMHKDSEQGLIPFFVMATLGTTGSCAFDDLARIGPICEEFKVWFHVDAAYAGNAFVCPEFRYLMEGVQFANSFNVSVSKWLLITDPCCLLWVRDRKAFTAAFATDPLYLKHQHSNDVIDYRNWGFGLARSFRALKMWCVFRFYGVQKLQEFIRSQCKLAKSFETLLREDRRFKITNHVKMGLVCFRLKSTETSGGKEGKTEEEEVINEKLLDKVNRSGKVYMVPSRVDGEYMIRLCVHHRTTEEDLNLAYEVLCSKAEEVLKLGAEDGGGVSDK